MFLMPVDIFGAIQKGKEDANKANWEDIKNAAAVEQNWLANDNAQMNNWFSQGTFNNALRVNDLARQSAENGAILQNRLLPSMLTNADTGTINAQILNQVARATQPGMINQKINSANAGFNTSNAAAAEDNVAANVTMTTLPQFEEALRAYKTGQYDAQKIYGNNAGALTQSGVNTTLANNNYTQASATTATSLLGPQAEAIKNQITLAGMQLKELERSLAEARKFDPQRVKLLEESYAYKAQEMKTLMAQQAAIQGQLAAEAAEVQAKQKQTALSSPTATAPTATGMPPPPLPVGTDVASSAPPVAGMTPAPPPNYTKPSGAVQGNADATAGRIAQLKANAEHLKKSGLEGNIAYLSIQRQIQALEAGAK